MSLYSTYFGAISVKDPTFGAVGDAVHDDTAAIQAAFDFAFGPASAPHGQANSLNRRVHFPKGQYKVTAPLVLTAVWGGVITGDGPGQTSIGLGSILSPISEGWCPTLWCNGVNFTRIEGIGFYGTSDPTNHSTVCIWFGPDGANGGSSAHGNTLIDIQTGLASWGVIHGSSHSAANSENTYMDSYFSNHEQAGFFVSGANTLNFRIIGGGATGCHTGIKTNNSATVPVIQSVAFDNNYQDIDLAASAQATIIGVRTEAGAFLKTNAAPTIVQNCTQARSGGTLLGHTSGPAASFTGTITGSPPTLTVTSGSPANLRKGMKIYGAGVATAQELDSPVVGGGNLTWDCLLGQSPVSSPTAMTAGAILNVTDLGSTGEVGVTYTLTGSDGTNSLFHGFSGGMSIVCRILDTTNGSTGGLGDYLISDAPTPGNLGPSTSLLQHPVLFEIKGSGSIIADGCGGEADSIIKADNNSVLFLRGYQGLDQIHGGTSADLFTYSQASMPQYDNMFTGNPTVANLPAPSAGMKGAKMFVVDYNGALTFGLSVIGHGGGSLTAPVWCSGSDWLIG